MTKEDFDAEVYEYAKSRNGTEDSRMTDRMLAYRAGAESREKEIKSLGERCLQLQKDKGNLIDKVNDLEDKLANADYQLEGRDLEIMELKEEQKEMLQLIEALSQEVNALGGDYNMIEHAEKILMKKGYYENEI